jgi:hypothetical protein
VLEGVPRHGEDRVHEATLDGECLAQHLGVGLHAHWSLGEGALGQPAFSWARAKAAAGLADSAMAPKRRRPGRPRRRAQAGAERIPSRYAADWAPTRAPTKGMRAGRRFDFVPWLYLFVGKYPVPNYTPG